MKYFILQRTRYVPENKLMRMKFALICLLIINFIKGKFVNIVYSVL